MQVQDPSKKTSITSLLNPQEASRYPAQTQTPDLLVASQSHTVIYENAPYDASNLYHPRTASWEAAEDPRRQVVPATQVQHHYQSQYHMVPTYSTVPQVYSSSSMQSSWQSSKDLTQQSSQDFNRQAIYSDEQAVWQHGDRASARIVAKDTQVQPQQQEPYTQFLTSTSTKRPLPESETVPAPKSKRAKAKSSTDSTKTPGTSKRGYTTKKRNEAAVISAKNDEALKRSQCGDSSGMSLVPELQSARCMSNRYKNEDFPRCVSCTRRWAGDTCRFQKIRYFIRDDKNNLCGMSFSEAHPPSLQTINFPTQWNRKFEKTHINRSKLSIAKALLPVLLKEQQHIRVDDIVRRARETDVRATCDTCMTSLFVATFMCRLCGREVCDDCFQQVRELTGEPENATPAQLAAFAQRREKYSRANPFFLNCTRRNDHIVTDFTPVTRFIAPELEKAIHEMQDFLASNAQADAERASEATTETLGDSTQHEDAIRPHTTSANTQNLPDLLINPQYDDYVPAREPPHITSIPTYQSQIIPASYFDPPTQSSTSATFPAFSSLWRQGLPLLVKDVLPRFKLQWSPKSFAERYGDNACLVVECQTDTNKRVTIKEFFESFGKYEGRTECWKLKDWPTNTDFKTACPDLYEDFSNAVPVPDYVRRDGVYNIGSHFPTNALGPDLGPKMYNSLASSQEPGSRGSTRLHMDMADALNVMLHAEACSDGSEGYAVWDLYRAEDSDKIRAFLKKRFGYNAASNGANGSNPGGSKSTGEKGASQGPPPIQMIGHDGIHNQQFYLDVELRKALWEECGVKSYRIYQRPGDGVFIPAGCAHQVANMSDCMKIAIDFVSPENIDRCEKLTKEFREQNQSKVWKEDVLQLRTMMWFAWQSCHNLEQDVSNGKEVVTTNLDDTGTSQLNEHGERDLA